MTACCWSWLYCCCLSAATAAVLPSCCASAICTLVCCIFCWLVLYSINSCCCFCFSVAASALAAIICACTSLCVACTACCTATLYAMPVFVRLRLPSSALWSAVSTLSMAATYSTLPAVRFILLTYSCCSEVSNCCMAAILTLRSTCSCCSSVRAFCSSAVYACCEAVICWCVRTTCIPPCTFAVNKPALAFSTMLSSAAMPVLLFCAMATLAMATLYVP